MKYFVIDSIARSGTTLLSALLRSQEKIVTFDGNFTEALHTTFNLGWPHETAIKPIVGGSLIQMGSFEGYKKEVCRIFENKRLSMGLTDQEVKNVFSGISNWDHTEKLYSRLGEKFNAKAVGFRWNQCNFYIDRWCNKSPSNHLWITMVRDPRDRIISNIKTHGWNFNKSVDITHAYSRKILDYGNTRKHLVVYYEDIINSPLQSLENIADFLDIKDIKIKIPKNLVGADNKAYRNQGWRVKKELQNHRHGKEYSGLFTSSIGQFSDHLSPKQIEQINALMRKYSPLYERYLI